MMEETKKKKVRLDVNGQMTPIFIECTCKRCKSKWIPRVQNRLPIQCPRCKSPYWNKDYGEKR